jgi:hypothetical protein
VLQINVKSAFGSGGKPYFAVDYFDPRFQFIRRQHRDAQARAYCRSDTLLTRRCENDMP